MSTDPQHGQHDGHLGKVYEAQAPEQVAAAYDAWAASYDAEMAAAGYRHPSIGCALLARHAPRGTGPVLDAGCGTGLLGDWLGILGFAPVEGLDLSAGMLAVARAKGRYARLHQLALGGPLPFADGAFAAVISTGVFTTGHVGAEALPELVRITQGGGPLVLTVKMTLWDGGFAEALHGMAGVEVMETTAPYVSMPGEPGTIPSLAVVLRRR
ncbi:class I SAM-dependent DNA methyltransferase [Pseudotabrizicola algicola]|uniref:Class I SAM-dependent methyltransferase n=1 Tax=Pseudotabrizicola algicola TaxID=2709381 RepID=A0A6B3RLM3_9RHOB|nr:class I SAM-dependent methyltransferase [Pseudotabrizicola algicola]NEX46341.1 class I SAM-dependent methyltransferase [Pseudotabrizicola algicola]